MVLSWVLLTIAGCICLGAVWHPLNLICHLNLMVQHLNIYIEGQFVGSTSPANINYTTFCLGSVETNRKLEVIIKANYIVCLIIPSYVANLIDMVLWEVVKENLGP